MKKFRFCFGMLASMALLASCGSPEASSSSSSEEESSIPSSSSLPDIEDSVGVLRLHYHRADRNYKPWNVWLWNYPSGAGAAYQFNGSDDFGAILEIGLSTFTKSIEDFQLGFIVRKGEWEAKDVEDDRVLDFPSYAAVDGTYDLYLKSGDATIYEEKPNPESIDFAAFTGEKKITVRSAEEMERVELFDGETSLSVSTEKGKSVIFELGEAGDVTKAYRVEAKFASGNVISRDVDISYLFDTSSFDDSFYYAGKDLGASYSKASTTFKVWSPVSNRISLRIYASGTPKALDADKGNDEYQEYELVKGDKGVFSVQVNGDLSGKYYTYVVFNAANPKGKEIVDPYAKSAGVNGKRGMVVDFSSTNPEGWDELKINPYDRKELTVYETHVADVTSSSSWGGPKEKAKKFLGMAEKGTKYNGTIATGFDHIKALGVNAVQLLPIFDQDNDEVNVSFNWGYNPLNYNVLEGAYSSDPYDGYARIKEFKTLVQSYVSEGINIIMDVVYNHVSNASASSFQALVPGYYFRLTSSGAYSNGSGCGNETASDRKMFGKFMQDSTEFWAKEYKLGGFRFDLMGLHDLDTMAALSKNLKSIDEHIVVYGEPWTGGSTPLSSSKQAKQSNFAKFDGYGAFNDKIRDGLIAGGLAQDGDVAWVDGFPYDGDVTQISNGIKGGISASSIDPDKNVSYVTCHDNFTLRDRFYAAGVKDEALLKRTNALAQTAASLSQGTFFMLAGEEFLRTKGGDKNSYQSSYKVNELDYSLLEKNGDLFSFYQKLIALKKNSPGLHLAANEAKAMEIHNDHEGYVIDYEFEGEGNRTYRVTLASPKVESKNIPLDFSGYTLYTTNREDLTLSSATPLKAVDAIIAYR